MSSREVRRVPPDWSHPRDKGGNYIPLFYGYSRDYDNYESIIIKDGKDKADEFWGKGGPKKELYMPEWDRKTESTHYQLYEIESEGTPVSPIVPSQEELAKWMHDNERCPNASTYDDWLQMVKSGSVSNHIFDAREIPYFVLSNHPKGEREIKFYDIDADNYHHYVGRACAGEDHIVTDDIVEFLLHGHHYDDRQKKESLGYMLRYVALSAKNLHTSLHDLMFEDAYRLKEQYPDRFTEEKAEGQSDQEWEMGKEEK